MIAPPPKDKEDDWNNFKEKTELVKNLKLIKKVPFDEIQKYFDEAKIFVNTSESEGFPNTFIQAGLAATPIASLKVDPDSFIQSNNCGNACHDDYQDLKRSISQMLTNVDIWKTKSQNILSYIKKNHNIETNIMILKQAIEKAN